MQINGDLNYRIDQRRENVIQAIESGDLDALLMHDQLLKEMNFNPGFRLRSFKEPPITFAPTYKYDRRSSEYDSSEKRRIPAWCDRILYKSRVSCRVEPLSYRRYEPKVSDHRPVSASFKIMAKQVHHEARVSIKAETEALWQLEEQKLLMAARDFLKQQGPMSR